MGDWKAARDESQNLKLPEAFEQQIKETARTMQVRFILLWWKDVDFLAELWEIPFERTGRRWWAQQLLVATSAWSVFVAIEGMFS